MPNCVHLKGVKVETESMSSVSNVDGVYEINVSGMSCPTPLNIVARELVKVPIGSRVIIKTDDYVCYMMLLRFLKILGESIERNEEGEGNTYIIVAVRAI